MESCVCHDRGRIVERMEIVSFVWREAKEGVEVGTIYLGTLLGKDIPYPVPQGKDMGMEGSRRQISVRERVSCLALACLK